VGAYFADDLDLAAAEADRSAAVTHHHAEGRAGAIAVAVAAAWAWQHRSDDRQADPLDMLRTAVARLDDSEIRRALTAIAEIGLDAAPRKIAGVFGSGHYITAHDTAPFCLWCAARHIDDYPEALWTAAEVGGDIDTTCAIIGGIVSQSVGPDGIPPHWRSTREPLPAV